MRIRELLKSQGIKKVEKLKKLVSTYSTLRLKQLVNYTNDISRADIPCAVNLYDNR